MDEMKISSKFSTGIISKIANRVIRRKTGYNIDIRLWDLQATILDKKAIVHVDLDATLSKEELDRLLKTLVFKDGAV